MTSKHDPTRPKVPDAVPLIAALYQAEGGGAGCCLHIVTDDHNLEHDSVDFCIDRAAAAGHMECERLARMLREMTYSQRKRAIAKAKAARR